MTTPKLARNKGELEKFITEREAERQAPGDAAKLTRVVRRIA